MLRRAGESSLPAHRRLTAVERLVRDRGLAEVAHAGLRLEQLDGDVVERRGAGVARDVRELAETVMHGQIGRRDGCVGNARANVDQGARPQGDPEVVGVVLVQQRRVVRWNADAQHADRRILVHEMMMRLALGEHGAWNRLRARQTRRGERRGE